MNKLLVGALALLVAVIGFGSLNAPSAKADPEAIVTVGCEFLAPFIDGDADDTTTGADLAAACSEAVVGDGNISEAEGETIAGVIGDGDGVIEASDFSDEGIDELDADQVDFDGDLTLEFIVIVNDDENVTVDPKTELSFMEESGPDGDLGCGTGDDGFTEEDCDDNGTAGDEAVWLTIFAVDADGADPGDSVNVVTVQDAISLGYTIEVVGNPDEITLVAVEETIQEGAGSGCADGTSPEVTDDEALTDLESTILIATITDTDDTALARILVDFSSDDEDVVEIGDSTGETLDAGASGLAAFAVACGGDPGTANVSAEFTDVETEDASIEITVIGEPDAIALTASPAQIACDGVQTSTVTATVTDSEGNNVVDGVEVRFDVVALGTSNPIKTTTSGGTASSVITPLSGATAGVTVLVSAGTVEASIRVDCSLPVPTPTTAGPAPTATPPGGIVGPVTGTGGYLTQDGASLPLWSLIALALGSVALVAGGMVTRKVSK